MAIRSGLAAQVGMSTESTYGTFATPTKFLPVTGIDLKKVKNVAQATAGAGAGRMGLLASMRVPTTKAAAGSIKAELLNRSFGMLLQALMGTTVTPAQQSTTAAYLQTHTLADPFGKSLTIQVGVPDAAGTVRPYSYLGCKVTGAEFSIEVDKPGEATFDIDACDVTESESLASASFATNLRPFVGTDMAVKVGTYSSETSVSGITKVNVKIERASKTDRFYAGGSALKAEPILNDYWKISGTITADLLDKTVFADRFAADTQFSLVVELLGPIIESTYKDTFRITLPGCFLDGDTPTVDGQDVVSGDFPFTCLFDGTNLPVIEVMSRDTSV